MILHCALCHMASHRQRGSLKSLSLPNTTITAAEMVPAGPYTPPAFRRTAAGREPRKGVAESRRPRQARRPAEDGARPHRR
jgi:hypothetical protein